MQIDLDKLGRLVDDNRRLVREYRGAAAEARRTQTEVGLLIAELAQDACDEKAEMLLAGPIETLASTDERELRDRFNMDPATVRRLLQQSRSLQRQNEALQGMRERMAESRVLINNLTAYARNMGEYVTP